MSTLSALAVRGVRWHLPFPPPRSYSGKPEATDAPRISRKPQRIVSTFNPSLIKSTDFVDVSQVKTFGVTLPAARSPPGQGLSYAFRGSSMRASFPAHARGFLYYYPGSREVPLEGGLRFRVSSDNAPYSFGSQDLLAPSGFPWQVALPKIACYAGYSWIATQLLHENLVAQDQLTLCQALFTDRLPTPEHLLFGLQSVFLVNFSSLLSMTVVGNSKHIVNLHELFKDSVHNCFPWSGTAVGRFEPSTLPEYAGRRVLHLRIVKIIQPVACNVPGYNGRVGRPEEGQLFTVYPRHAAGKPTPWAYDIDDSRRSLSSSSALQVLWDIPQTR
ncbi:hypothetical protein DFH09DRAFT_1165096 [Mycena vulgaris]|nr:hypothetical protein DFH09DRAFT_1165096 [Mycena vulgaris]